MAYIDEIQINENFQTSVNIDLDLNNEEKLSQYIPTNDICDVLSSYFDCFLGKNKNKATILEGPYGKGKSFLLLVLSFLISAETSNPVYKDLLSNIGSIDESLSQKIVQFRSSFKFIPVIVNPNYNDLNQAFLIGLSEALARFNLNEIVPKTTYQQCIQCIDNWKYNNQFDEKAAMKCLETNRISLDKLKNGLKSYSKEAYEQFLVLFDCVTGHVPFNPLVTDDVRRIFTEVVRELKKFGYDGVFVIFDEFSKFLDGDGENLFKDLKLIQDFAETAARSSKQEQIHLCCVTHKSLKFYNKDKDNSVSDSFKTVEGRFKEIRFNRSLEENYHIISASFKSSKKLTEMYKDFHKANPAFYQRVEEALDLKTDSEKKALFEGCYPINPLTVYALIHLSEMCAQNERTLFTFISDVDENGFNYFINRSGEGLLNIDKLFDYFSPSLKSDSSEAVRSIWYRAESVLSKLTDNDQRKIIKALAIIYIINDFDHLKPVSEAVADVIFLNPDTCQAKIDKLIEEHYLRNNGVNNFLTFASANSREIDERILTIKQTKLKSMELSSICDLVNDKKYYLPRRYNEENKITRFYRVVYLTEEQFFSLNSFQLLYSEQFSDGLVINVLRDSKDVRDVEQKVNEIQDRRTIVCPSKMPVDALLKNELLQYAALSEIMKEVEDSVVSREIELLLNESAEDLRKLLKKQFDGSLYFVYGMTTQNTRFIDMLSDVMASVYNKKVIFNYELVNRNILSAQYKKSVEGLSDAIISGKDITEKYPSETSPERSINATVLEHINNQPDVRLIIDTIKESILNSPMGGVDVAELVSDFTGFENGYGVRRGIMPLILAIAIHELSVEDNILLYYRQKEIDLDGSSLFKAVYSSSNYSLRFSKGSKDQTKYLTKMLGLFKVTSTGNVGQDLKILTSELSRFFTGLPAVIRNDQAGNDYLGIEDDILLYKNRFYHFNLNPFETIFVAAKKDFHSQNYSFIYKQIEKFKSEVDRILSAFKKKIVSRAKLTLEISDSSSLKMGMQNIIHTFLANQNPIISDRFKRAYELICNVTTYDDSEFINDLSYTLIGSYIEDWNGNRSEEFIDALDSFFNELKQAKTSSISSSSLKQITSAVDAIEVSPIGELLESNLKNTLSEYGESVSNEEKVAILVKLLKEAI